ncbi:unnamed protein product [Staurois parvus]|uniref:Secreted protein n=1 Tax=Staurois parvus TaxID=386267 RepID=A0ABN9BRK6_9NEOB|nr:unnamed protein product [Staurois parvus]
MPRPLPLLPRLLAPETLPPLPLLCVLSDILFNSIVVVKQKVSLFSTIGQLQLAVGWKLYVSVTGMH